MVNWFLLYLTPDSHRLSVLNSGPVDLHLMSFVNTLTVFLLPLSPSPSVGCLLPSSDWINAGVVACCGAFFFLSHKSFVSNSFQVPWMACSVPCLWLSRWWICWLHCLKFYLCEVTMWTLLFLRHHPHRLCCLFLQSLWFVLCSLMLLMSFAIILSNIMALVFSHPVLCMTLKFYYNLCKSMVFIAVERLL